ncbi:cobalt ECF transporter T component CbiQ [Acidobacteriota bacterium]
MKHDYFDKYCGLGSFIHLLDPRTKILTFLAAIGIIVSEPRGDILPFMFYYTLLITLLGISRIPLSFVLKRCLIAFPFILMAAIGLPLSHLAGSTGSSTFTTQMAFSSLSIVLKAVGAVIILVLLTSTSKFQMLLKGMRSLRMPPVLGVMSALMYRYLFILNDERLRTNRARESRTPGRLRLNRFKVLGHQVALVFLRSWSRAHTVYYSMLSRGFQGEFPGFSPLKFHWQDGLFFLVCISSLLTVRYFV